MPPHHRTLRVPLLGRRVQPVAAGLAGLMALFTVRIFTDTATSAFLNTDVGDLAGLACLFSCGLLCAGWWTRRHRLLCAGLLWAACLLGGITAVTFVERDVDSWDGWSLMCLFVIAGGSWWLEVVDPDPPR